MGERDYGDWSRAELVAEQQRLQDELRTVSKREVATSGHKVRKRSKESALKGRLRSVQSELAARKDLARQQIQEEHEEVVESRYVDRLLRATLHLYDKSAQAGNLPALVEEADAIVRAVEEFAYADDA